MSQHQLKTLAEDFKATKSNVATLKQKCHDIVLMDQTYRSNVATSTSDQHVNVVTLVPSNLNSEISPMLRHRINVATSTKDIKRKLLNNKIQCRDITTVLRHQPEMITMNLNDQCRNISYNNVAASVQVCTSKGLSFSNVATSGQCRNIRAMLQHQLNVTTQE